MTTEIKSCLKYANLQMAAEALFGKQGAEPGSTFSGVIQPTFLIDGNNRSSKFTATQAAEFSLDWEVVQHKSNTSTGFSGTLFRARRTDESRGIREGELVLSFRSTEFQDDAARDNQATNKMEVAEYGWAFGQIADMEAWYGTLREDPLLLEGKTFSVTGYSLGGHLATAFTQLRAEEAASNGTQNPVNATYTFNGAGVGKLTAPTLTQVIEGFRQRSLQGANAAKGRIAVLLRDLAEVKLSGRAIERIATSSI